MNIKCAIIASLVGLGFTPSYGEDAKFSDLEKVSYYWTLKGAISETGPRDCLTYTANMRNWAGYNLEQRKSHSCSPAGGNVPNAILCDNSVVPYGIYNRETGEVHLYHVYIALNANPKYDVWLPHPDKAMNFLYALRFKVGASNGMLSMAVVDKKYLFRDVRVPAGQPYQGYFFPPAPDPKHEKYECELMVEVEIKFQDKQ